MANIESPEEGWSDDEETPEKGKCSHEIKLINILASEKTEASVKIENEVANQAA